VTLPVRFLTTPFVIYYRHHCPQKEHPVINLIKNHPQSIQVVNLSYQMEEVVIEPSVPHAYPRAKKSIVKETIPVVLKALPTITRQCFNKEEEWLYIDRGVGGWSQRSHHHSFSSEGSCGFTLIID